MEKIMTIPVFRDEKTGEQWIQAVFQFPKCGCKIIGGGTCTQPLRIEFCDKHKEGKVIFE